MLESLVNKRVANYWNSNFSIILKTYPSFTSATLPETCALSGSGDTDTSINLTNFQAKYKTDKYISQKLK